jgi:hypothetical protein
MRNAAFLTLAEQCGFFIDDDLRRFQPWHPEAANAGDFRVQEEHGSEIRSISPEPALLAAGKAAIAAIGRKLLYARAGPVRHGEEFRVMELELVEPALYLRMDPGAPGRFADAIVSLFA